MNTLLTRTTCTRERLKPTHPDVRIMLIGDGMEKPAIMEDARRRDLDTVLFVDAVPKNVWEFHVGGYQVCEKWLKDRKGRALSSEDINHYQRVIVALQATIRLMAEIDGLIPGWPM